MLTEARVPVTDDALVAVAEIDRKAAASAYPTLSISIMSGDMDESENVQAFARHRLAGVAAGREEGLEMAAQFIEEQPTKVRGPFFWHCNRTASAIRQMAPK